MKRIFLLFFVTVLVWPSWSQTFLQEMKTRFFDPQTSPRIGLEVELTGLTQEEIGFFLQKELGGTLKWHIFNEENLNTNTGLKEVYEVQELHLHDSLMVQPVVIKAEENVVDSKNIVEMKSRTRIYEIVTPPIHYLQAVPLQVALNAMRSAGAQGTDEGHAVAIQVNVEMGQGRAADISIDVILSILRNYLLPENKKDIAEERNVLASRRAYIGPYSEGMMQRILNLAYRPTMDQFFMDFMYRQSLEVLGFKDAWSMSEAEARAHLEAWMSPKKFEALLKVVKWNDIRVSAVLMFLYPKDPLTLYLLETTWFHDYPILEFREPNSDFQLLKVLEETLGLVQYSERFRDVVIWDSESKKLQNLGFAPRFCRDLFFN